MQDENNNQYSEEVIKTENSVRVSDSIIPEVKPEPIDKNLLDIKKNKDIAALSYAWMLCIPIYIFRKDSPFIQKHARQSLYLFGFSLFSWFLASIPFIWWIGTVLLFVYLFVMLKGIMQAFAGEEYDIPFLTAYLEEHNTSVIASLKSKLELPKDISETIKKQITEEQEALSQISNKVHNVVGNLDEKKEENNE